MENRPVQNNPSLTARTFILCSNFLNLKNAHIIGLSFGGAIAIDFALDHPEMVDTLILAATATSTDATSEKNIESILTLSSMAKREGIEQVIQLILDAPSFISGANPATRETIRQIYLDNRDVFEDGFPLVRLWRPVRPPASTRLREIHARVLIIEGENDHPGNKSMSEKLMGIVGATKIVIEGAGHAVNLDKPTEFNKSVLEFLDKK